MNKRRQVGTAVASGFSTQGNLSRRTITRGKKRNQGYSGVSRDEKDNICTKDRRRGEEGYTATICFPNEKGGRLSA